MSLTTFPSKVNAETVTETFDFQSRLALAETLSTASVVATVYSGTDASPSAVISGSATISGAQVKQKVTGGIEGNLYTLTCTVTTSGGQTLIVAGTLAIVPVSV